ncbi:MAG: ankyrin repeat domain-containing protein, partial [Proteobacteria bacterium]|nr:ankyrin repeat domain-containing protein [Pseudomonadota bacterium]
RINTLDYLLGQGADVMRTDAKGETALIHAIRNREAAAVKFLLKSQAEKNYSFDVNENNTKVKACDIAREVRAASSSSQEKKRSEDVMWELGCGLRWLFSW